MKLNLAMLEAAANYRSPGYLADILACGLKREDGRIELSEEDFQRIRRQYGGPCQDWPIWAVVAALFAAPVDVGVGDTIARECGPPKSEGWKRHHEAVFGIMAAPCGCGEQRQWNRLYPYELPASAALAINAS